MFKKDLGIGAVTLWVEGLSLSFEREALSSGPGTCVNTDEACVCNLSIGEDVWIHGTWWPDSLASQ